ncbi:hypothetical protein T484DRAFT_1812770 [Baffinella frigidus]|nr:hypothetical protein T484DRAFT_1812770 [Cryptophyta sp. CCMP2293]
MKRLGALFNGYLHQSWGPTTVTMVEAKLEETLVAEVLLGRPALRGEPALARSLAMEETRRMLGSEATLQGLDRVLASLYQPLRFHIEEELKGCMEQRSVHAFIKEWTARRAAVARLCATAAADWPKLLADAVVRELEKRPEAPADMEGRRALREAPPFVLSRFPTFVKALGEELLAHFEEQATVALAAVERSVGPFFEGFCSSARPQFPNVDVDDAGNPRQDATVVPVVEMVPVSEDTAGQNVAAPNPYGHAYGCGCAHCAQHARQVAPVVQPGRALGGAARLADGVAFAFMRALTVTECPDDVLARAAAALGDADWDEASALAEQREKAVARREQLERVLAGIVEMLGEPGDAGVFVFPVRELKHVRSFGAGQLICSGGVAVDLVGNVFAKHVHNPTHVMVFNSGGTHVAWCTQGLSDVLGLARDGQGNIIISSGNKTFAVFGGGVQLCQFLRSINVSQSAPTLRSPHGMAVDSAGNIWVAELNLNQVIVLAPDGTFIKAVGASQLEKPSGVALDQGGNLYVTEVGKQRVSVFSPDGKLTRRFGEGPHLSANLGGVAVDGAGCVLVVDRGMRRVAMFGPHGRFVSSFGNGLLVGPDCLAVDAAGQVFVTDNNQIQVFA